MNNTTVVDATAALLSEREKTHGRFKDNARITNHLRDFARHQPGWPGLDSEEKCSLDEIALKLARVLSGGKDRLDCWRDIAGYARLIVDRQPAPLSPRFAEHQARMDERLHACPDLDQEFPECPTCQVKHLPNQGCTYPVP